MSSNNKHPKPYHLLTIYPTVISAVTPALLMKSSSVRGEVIGIGLSDDPTLCPVKAIVSYVIHLREHQASPKNTLSLCYSINCWHPVTPTHVSAILNNTFTYLGPTLGFLATEISAQCLCASGDNALLNAHIEPKSTPLISLWRSDEMFRYLHVQNRNLMKYYAANVLQHGNYNLTTNKHVPMQ